jgi:hypothetical protein
MFNVIPDGTLLTDLMQFNMTVNVDAKNGTFCVDSSFYVPGNEFLWVWDGDGYTPSWGGPYCWEIFEIENQPPVFTPDVDTLTLTASHCDLFTHTFVAHDQDVIPNDPPVITYSTAGLGTVGASSGAFSYLPSFGDVGAPIAFTVTASDGLLSTDQTLMVTFTNIGPAFTNCPAGELPVGQGNPISFDLNAADGDCETGLVYSLGVVQGNGVATVDPVTGLFTYNSVLADAEQTFDFEVIVSDGAATATCVVTVRVLSTTPFEVLIEKTHQTYQGLHEHVDVSVTEGSEELWGFDILVAYDASALSFQSAIPGDIYTTCKWEYFTFRFGADGNCGNGCPSGLVRVIGIAETNNGANHPTCFKMAMPYTLFTLDFLVSDDRTFECQYVPIRFFWFDCGDNAFSYHEIADEDNPYSQILGISRFVYDFDLIGDITDPNYEWGYPTFTGAQNSDCFVGDPNKVPVRFVDFYNGGIDIACADSIDKRGDLNLNEIANEIADAVLYSNYFVYGLSAFGGLNIQGVIAASDVNADGKALSVADLVYLIRVVQGDAVPYAKLVTVPAEVTVGTTVSVDGDMGAAHLTVAGEVAPELLADNMEMIYNFNGTSTEIVVWSRTGESFTGEFIQPNGNLLNIELATREGAPVSHSIVSVPTGYALMQNYPNPFNPTTTIAFYLEAAGDYTLTIYNVAGQEVSKVAGNGNAGTNSYEFDASNVASGIYFYKLDAGNFSDTKKMVLLK